MQTVNVSELIRVDNDYVQQMAPQAVCCKLHGDWAASIEAAAAASDAGAFDDADSSNATNTNNSTNTSPSAADAKQVLSLFTTLLRDKALNVQIVDKKPRKAGHTRRSTATRASLGANSAVISLQRDNTKPVNVMVSLAFNETSDEMQTAVQPVLVDVTELLKRQLEQLKAQPSSKTASDTQPNQQRPPNKTSSASTLPVTTGMS